MTADELVANAYLQATGEVSTLTSSDNDWKKMLNFANFYIGVWAREPGVDWESLYDPSVDVGTVSNTDSYDLDDDIIKLSNQPDDYVKITTTDGKVIKYDTVSPNNLKRFDRGQYCAKAGQQLIFNKVFTSDDREFGGAITVAAYIKPDPLVSSTDEIPVDDPNWLVFMCAAKWVQTDVTLAQNRPDLVAEANNAMAGMKAANRAQADTIPMGKATRGV